MVRVYPNPTNDHLTVENPASNSADRYSIKNVLGQIVLDGNLVSGEQDIDVSHLVEGNYIISVYKGGIQSGNTMFVKK